MTKVLVIDDHPIVLQGCRLLLEDIGACDVREAATLTSGYRSFHRQKPDLVIVDLGMQGRSLGGIELIRRLRLDGRKFGILVFTMHNDPIVVRRALDAGANGYVLKDSPPTALREAIQKVRAGQTYLAHSIALEVAMLGTRKNKDPIDDLTPREIQVLTLLAEGNQYSQIADALEVSYKTVANTCSQIKSKLGVTTLPQLIRVAVRWVANAGETRKGSGEADAGGTGGSAAPDPVRRERGPSSKAKN